jgi:hypothetical protein
MKKEYDFSKLKELKNPTQPRKRKNRTLKTTGMRHPAVLGQMP